LLEDQRQVVVLQGVGIQVQRAVGAAVFAQAASSGILVVRVAG
jgi:hypothetical protein